MRKLLQLANGELILTYGEVEFIFSLYFLLLKDLLEKLTQTTA